MEIPVTGYVVHNKDSDSEHSHILYLTSWNGRPIHVHEFSGVTSFDVGHDHRYAGKTEPAPSGVKHVHHYCTFTSVDNDHKHIIKGTTGPAIPLPRGGHYHYFEGCTSVSGLTPHAHQYCGKTGNELDYC
ncbi:YmaF family protein [Paenibacillus alkaliterrae]|uniref:YmaF family protein n=1 Tax=Paenibacillus alkaliterrae TaxID=320909 RepID=UPI001F3E5EA7|nr:YmaF family protein [Paenibacillus alkaliterrae]MCF2938670.1 YmaF family protein [Paenibacillus alkaliterrae]